MVRFFKRYDLHPVVWQISDKLKTRVCKSNLTILLTEKTYRGIIRVGADAGRHKKYSFSDGPLHTGTSSQTLVLKGEEEDAKQ